MPVGNIGRIMSLQMIRRSGSRFRLLPVICQISRNVSKYAPCSALLIKEHPVRRNSRSARQYSTEFTSVRYPHIKRGNFGKVTEEDVKYFEELLPGDGRVLTAEDDVEAYNTDWLRIVRGASKVVLRPKTTQEVSAILSYCNEHQLAVATQGGNTGLVGGSVPVFDEIVLSMQLMNKIISLDELAGSLVCQAGCILEQLDDHLASHNLMMPLDLGAKGSCHIGGNISTNAGGIRLLRYGSLHGSVLGVEAVLPSGEIVDCLSTLRKDNTGYDLKQLFIGSEGTLGVVTAVSVLCPQKPSSVNVAFLGCQSFSHVLSTYKAARHELGEILSAYELIDAAAMTCARENLHLSNPLQTDHPFYVLIETSGSNAQHDEEKLNAFLENAMTSGIIDDGTVATEVSKIKALWSLRERLAESLLHDGYCFKYDLSIPLTHFYELVEIMRKRCEGHATRVVAYGHVGDSNLHLNITAPRYNKQIANLIEPFVYEFTAKHSGSISAEHGLGFMKNKYIHMSKKAEAVELMHQIKQLIDPNQILNPYKTLPKK